ncbi:MAG: OmpA family protein [Gemmatimonadales bacterium]
MRRAVLVIAGLALSAPVGNLTAQSKGTFEIGGFGRYALKYDDSYMTVDESRDRWGGGARIGYFIGNNFALEIDGNANPTDIKANAPGLCEAARSCPLLHRNANLRGIYNIGNGGIGFMLGAGVGVTKLTKAIDHTALTISGLAGIRLRPASWFNIRLEGVVGFIPNGWNDESNTNIALQAGASLLFGGCSHDGDMISISPTSVTLEPGQSQTFSSTAMYCGKDDAMVYRLTGPGSLDSLTGRYTATTPGTAQVTAYSKKGGLMSSANVTVRTPPPPAPAPAPAPMPAPAPAPRATFELATVHFRFDRSDLTAGGRDTVMAIVNTLKARPTVNVDVVGHTDWIGTNAYNMKLSQARAETVRRMLVENGISESRIMVKWRGEEEPVADNGSTAGRALNRRTEVKQNN